MFLYNWKYISSSPLLLELIYNFTMIDNISWKAVVPSFSHLESPVEMGKWLSLKWMLRLFESCKHWECVFLYVFGSEIIKTTTYFFIFVPLLTFFPLFHMLIFCQWVYLTCWSLKCLNSLFTTKKFTRIEYYYLYFLKSFLLFICQNK